MFEYMYMLSQYLKGWAVLCYDIKDIVQFGHVKKKKMKLKDGEKL